MSLSELFEMQRVLDERIVKEKGLEGQDLLPQKILALQVELGECANEWRGFKFWSDDQQARTWQIRNVMLEHGPSQEHYNPLLEEYIDCLHFILSIGLCEYSEHHVKMPIYWGDERGLIPVRYKDEVTQFNKLFDNIGYLSDCVGEKEVGSYSEIPEQYRFILQIFQGLGSLLGFTQDQIAEAYKAKNAINHKRQDTGY